MSMRMVTQPEADEVSPAARTLYARLRHRYLDDGGFVLDAEFVLETGITVLFGPSGAGKTTILDSLAGLVSPDSGRITIGEQVLFDSERRVNVATPKRGLGYLFQDLALFPHMTVRQNVEYGTHRLERSVRGQRSAAALEAFRISHLAERRPGDISGGERQRVALARALVTNPGYLLLDEPLSALDVATKSKIVSDLRTWNRDHRIPVLFVTHDREEVYALAERVLVIERGKLVADGRPQEVFEAPRRESIAQLAGFENVFGALVVSTNTEQGTMRCRLLPPIDNAATALETVFSNSAGVEVEVPLTGATEGARLRVAVRAGDILIANEAPRGLSARNVLRARIVHLERRDGVVLVRTKCGAEGEQAGVGFEVHVTPGAVGSLGLRQGSAVWLVIKTHSLHVLAG